MNEEAALLRAICENPDDDTPRLVFADWLQEHDRPERAEYIRIQIARQRRHLDPHEDDRLYLREVALYREFAAQWYHELPPGYKSALVGAERGFWNRAHAPARAVLDCAGDPYARLIDELVVTTAPSADELARLLALPHVRGIRVLVLAGLGLPLGTEGGAALAATPFPRLETLRVYGQRVGDRAALERAGRRTSRNCASWTSPRTTFPTPGPKRWCGSCPVA